MENSQQYNSFSLVRFLWKWRKWLLIICAIAFVLSAVCSCFIKPKFKSTATIYAPRTNSTAKILLNEQNYNERLDIKAYAIEAETEQMMQLLDAQEIKDSLIAKYNLAEAYGIDTKSKGWKTRLNKTLMGNMTIKRTDYGAIDISVADWDAQRACDMTMDILRYIDTLKNRVERERSLAAYRILQHQVDSVDGEIQRCEDSLRVCMEHGVFDFEYQSERLMQQYAIAVAQGNTAALNRLKAEQEILAEWGPKVVVLRELIENFSKYQSMCRQKMMDARVDMENEIPVKFVVNSPQVADKKFYPKRSLVVLVSTFCVLVISVFVLLMIEKIEEKPSVKAEESVE